MKIDRDENKMPYGRLITDYLDLPGTNLASKSVSNTIQYSDISETVMGMANEKQEETINPNLQKAYDYFDSFKTFFGNNHFGQEEKRKFESALSDHLAANSYGPVFSEDQKSVLKYAKKTFGELSDSQAANFVFAEANQVIDNLCDRFVR